jgi:uncharacterized coiled-coil protein SlyX
MSRDERRRWAMVLQAHYITDKTAERPMRPASDGSRVNKGNTVELTRRSFNTGLAGVITRSAAGPITAGQSTAGTGGSSVGIDDAYERLLGEYIRIEEAAIAAGETAGDATGASTFVGRQLEAFIGELDQAIGADASVTDVYDAFRVRLRRAVERMDDVCSERGAPDEVEPPPHAIADVPDELAGDGATASAREPGCEERGTRAEVLTARDGHVQPIEDDPPGARKVRHRVALSDGPAEDH